MYRRAADTSRVVLAYPYMALTAGAGAAACSTRVHSRPRRPPVTLPVPAFFGLRRASR